MRWAAEHDVRLQFITPGKPTQNANIESLNARIRDEFLNEHAFLTLADARREAELWLLHYNEIRPHGALRFMTPNEFAAAHERQTARYRLRDIGGLTSRTVMVRVGERSGISRSVA